METELKDIREELIKIRVTMEVMKNVLLLGKDPEGELSDWAKKELVTARSEKGEGYISLEEL